MPKSIYRPRSWSINHKASTFTSDRCLICMEPFESGEILHHKRCAQELFGFSQAPSIDVSMEDPEEMALPMNGKKNKLQWLDFVALGNSYKIPAKVMVRVRDQILDSFFDAEDLIERSFLSEAKKVEFLELLRERSERLSK